MRLLAPGYAHVGTAALGCPAEQSSASSAKGSYNTRTSLRSLSTNFLAISADEPSINSVFLVFCGTYSRSIFCELPVIEGCTSAMEILRKGLFLACLMPI